MSEKNDVLNQLNGIESIPDFSVPFTDDYTLVKKIAGHKAWLKSIRHEQPNPKHHFNVGIYIRYFNQTKHDNYLEYHVNQYKDTMALLPNWELVDFYIDEGATAPNMESAKEWCRLLKDSFAGKVDLIITQKVSNVSKKYYEIAVLARVLSALKKPVGIYFVSEDIYTLASYYIHDKRDTEFFPSPDWELLPDDELDVSQLFLGGTVDD